MTNTSSIQQKQKQKNLRIQNHWNDHELNSKLQCIHMMNELIRVKNKSKKWYTKTKKYKKCLIIWTVTISKTIFSFLHVVVTYVMHFHFCSLKFFFLLFVSFAWMTFLNPYYFDIFHEKCDSLTIQCYVTYNNNNNNSKWWWW